MIAIYKEENNDEIFTVIELFNNVVINFEKEIFKEIMLSTHVTII